MDDPCIYDLRSGNILVRLTASGEDKTARQARVGGQLANLKGCGGLRIPEMANRLNTGGKCGKGDLLQPWIILSIFRRAGTGLDHGVRQSAEAAGIIFASMENA